MTQRTVILSASISWKCVVLVENVANDFRCTKHFILRIILFNVINATFWQHSVVIKMPHCLRPFVMVPLGAIIVVMMMMLLEATNAAFRLTVMLFSIFYDVLKPKWILFDLWWVLLRRPVNLLTHITAGRVVFTFVDEFQIVRGELLRKVEWGRFKSYKRLLSG